MFIACPHCRELIAPHPLTRQLPAHCPRCGGELPQRSQNGPASTDDKCAVNNPTALEAANASPSLVSLLRPSQATATAVTNQTPDAEPALQAQRLAPTGEDDERGSEHAEHDAACAQSEQIEVAPVAEPAATDLQPAHAAVSVGAEADIVEPTPIAQASAAVAAATTQTSPRRTARTPAASPAPSFMQAGRTRAVRSHSTRWQWLALIALTTTLILQVMLADRNRLASHAGSRPLLVALCGVFGCSLPSWREPTAFVMVSRDVRPIGNAPGTLLAQATFRNDARWPQPWPVLLLTLKDTDGRTLGARALTPMDYLEPAVIAHEIEPGQSAQVSVRVREPSASVVAFSFDFH